MPSIVVVTFAEIKGVVTDGGPPPVLGLISGVTDGVSFEIIEDRFEK